jgi:hypothetical protein
MNYFHVDKFGQEKETKKILPVSVNNGSILIIVLGKN